MSSSENHSRRLARLAAVQGLYQTALTQRTAENVIRDFREHPSRLLQEVDESATVPEVDHELFGLIVLGVEQNLIAIDDMIAGSCTANVSVARIEILLRAILRAGAYELHHNTTVPAGVIINDYIEIAHAFFGAKEPGLVNAVLDRLAKKLRSV